MTLEDNNSPVVKEQQEIFIKSVKEYLTSPCDLKTEVFEGEDEPNEDYGDADGDDPGIPEADEADYDTFDKYIQSEVLLPQGDRIALAKVKRRKRTWMA